MVECHYAEKGMINKLDIKNVPDELNVRKFSQVLDSPSQCYKFYWLEAILQLLKETGERSFRFEDIIDRMIVNAWYTVSMYHLHLGPGRIDNKNSDKVEMAVITLKEVSPGLAETAEQKEIVSQLHEHHSDVYYAKNELTKNVPYRLLSPFLKVNQKDWYKRNRMIDIIAQANESEPLPYVIINAKEALNCQIVVNDEWASWILREYPILIDWINMNKVVFLQARNPEVPGIIYKLEPPHMRKLTHVKNLWDGILARTEIKDIYSGDLLNDEKYDIDHFVPWSYVAMDEIWNLIPAEKTYNSSKNNRLPDWSLYVNGYLDTHYRLYQMIFKDDQIFSLFKKCQVNNLNSQWAINQLYVENVSESDFKNTLESNLKRVYNSAIIQGYSVWSGKR